MGSVSMIRFEAVTFLLNQYVQGDQITTVRGPCVAITHLSNQGTGVISSTIIRNYYTDQTSLTADRCKSEVFLVY